MSLPSPLTAGIVGTTSRSAPVRLGRFGDIARLFPDETRAPALVAAAVALLEGVQRVVVAPTLADLPSEPSGIDAIVIADRLDRDARAALRAPQREVPVLVDLASDVTAGEVLAARARGVRFVHPGGAVLLPGQRHGLPIGGAALALPLLFGRPALGALCELHPAPLDDALAAAGVLALTRMTPPRSGPRITLPPGESHLPARRAASLAPSPTSGPTARLEAALGELAQRFSHRLERGPAALASLEREAQRLLQTEVASGAITRYALALHPDGDDLAIEVLVWLPKRVGQVVIRVNQR